ncbi:hypothetical protein SK128_005510 [Halocaridina rubra]|uniref:Uncharacterized protein n=1 Tax=Halocaridina rubra TaxID=373956 RepID=A0AAN8X5X9_HALRR
MPMVREIKPTTAGARGIFGACEVTTSNDFGRRRIGSRESAEWSTAAPSSLQWLYARKTKVHKTTLATLQLGQDETISPKRSLLPIIRLAGLIT